MLRSMLQQVFGLKSYSAYDDADSVGLLPEIRDKTGHTFLGESMDTFYKRNVSSDELFLVKLHHTPVDAGRAIYIVRDGRSSIVSRYNLLLNLRNRTDVTISDIIRGNVLHGDWSSHLRAWDPLNRPATLFLRYQDLLQRPAEAMDRVATFIQRTPIGTWQNNFEELHRIFPQFFHGGSDEKNLAQMTSQEHQLFWTLHRECMQRYGLGAP